MENSTMPSVEDIQAAFGITAEEPEESTESNDPVEEVSETSAEETTDETPNSEGADEGTAQEGSGQNTQGSQNQESHKQNQAFARMRTENAQMQKTLMAMAQVLGVDSKLPIDQLASQLQSQAMNAIAKANNIDPAILQRLDQLEAINAEYTQARIEREIMSSFDTITKKYGATEDDLAAFLNDVVADGYDLANNSKNLESEFIRRNFDTIRQRMIDQAVQDEQNRAVKGSGASNPPEKQGQDDNTETHNIGSISELDNFLAGLTKR